MIDDSSPPDDPNGGLNADGAAATARQLTAYCVVAFLLVLRSRTGVSYRIYRIRPSGSMCLHGYLSSLRAGRLQGQFFPDIVDFCEAQANAGRTVIVSALDGDFRRKPFGRILELVPMAERVDKLTAVCVKCCGASFSSAL